MSIYTHSERTVRKYTVYQAIESARRRLADKGHHGPVCTNAVSRRGDAEKITLEELNEISESIYSDTLYYEYAR